MTIYLENISKSYGGVNVLNDFNVNIEDGKCYAFIGPEGSGKSTVLKIFMGTEKPDSGKVSRMGDYNPTINLCIQICKVLGKTLDELFWEEEP